MNSLVHLPLTSKKPNDRKESLKNQWNEMLFFARPSKGQVSMSKEAPLKYECSARPCLLIASLSRQCQFCKSTCRLSRQDVKGPCRSCCLALSKGPKALVYYRRHPKDRCFRLRGVMENNSTLDS